MPPIGRPWFTVTDATPFGSSVTAEPPMIMLPLDVASENVTVPVGTAPPDSEETVAENVIAADGL